MLDASDGCNKFVIREIRGPLREPRRFVIRGALSTL
jgi:hypothetical protein